MTMQHRTQADFARYSDEELYNPDNVYWSEEERAAAKAEKKRREDAKLSEQERIAQERAATLKAAKNAVPYSEELATEICGRISAGELLINVCAEPDMPTVKRCNEWLKLHSDFKALYDESIQDRLLIFEEELIQISDFMKDDFKTVIKNGKERRVVDPEVIARAKLRVESRFRYLRAYKPERWGETSTIITKSVDDFDGLSLDELDAKIGELSGNNEAVRSVA
jgi:hypothetical protein